MFLWIVYLRMREGRGGGGRSTLIKGSEGKAVPLMSNARCQLLFLPKTSSAFSCVKRQKLFCYARRETPAIGCLAVKFSWITATSAISTVSYKKPPFRLFFQIIPAKTAWLLEIIMFNSCYRLAVLLTISSITATIQCCACKFNSTSSLCKLPQKSIFKDKIANTSKITSVIFDEIATRFT